MKLKSICMAFLLTGSSYLTHAQFNFNAIGPPFSEGQTVPTVQTIGIGNWPVNTATNARLHASNYYCAAPNGTFDGFMFRTDAKRNVRSRWQMFTGTPAGGNLNEKGVLFTDPATPTQTIFGWGLPLVVNQSFNHFSVQATQGDLILNAQGSLTALPFGNPF